MKIILQIAIVTALLLSSPSNLFAGRPTAADAFRNTSQPTATLQVGQVRGEGKTPYEAQAQAQARLNGYSNVQITSTRAGGNAQSRYSFTIDFKYSR